MGGRAHTDLRESEIAREERIAYALALTDRRGAAVDKPRRRTEDFWLEKWLRSTADLSRLQYAHPMVDAVIDEQHGRDIRIGDHWLSDFASCNYLGFDLDEEIIAAIPEYLAKWGTHPSWSRLLGSPYFYEQIEETLTDLLGVPDTLMLPTVSQIHSSVLPVLAGSGTIFLDGRSHKSMFDGGSVARERGAQVSRFRHNNLDELEALLKEPWRPPGVIALDGINSMTGNPPDLPKFAALAREHGALLYVDEAHGFGIIGERSPDELCEYGRRGNAIVKHFGETYDGIILVGALSKAYSSLMAFICCPTAIKNILKTAAPPYVFSGPSPYASIATVIEGLKVNEKRGDIVRLRLYNLTTRLLDHVRRLGINISNTSNFPIVEFPLLDPDDIDEVGRILFDNGVYATMAPYPLVPRKEVGFRVQVTAANTNEQIDNLNRVLTEIADRCQTNRNVGVLQTHETV